MQDKSLRRGRVSSRSRQWLSTALRSAMTAMLIVCASLAATPAQADYSECKRSYDLKRMTEAFRLCRRTAWQDNDPFAQALLGDMYNPARGGGNLHKDPVEAAVWYYLAVINLRQAEHQFLGNVRTKIEGIMRGAEKAFESIYGSLTQDERIDLRDRVTYIQACRGPEGLMLLGQLHDPRFNRHTRANLHDGSDLEFIQTPLKQGGGQPKLSGGGTIGGFLTRGRPIEASMIESQLFYRLAAMGNHPFANDYLLTSAEVTLPDGTRMKPKDAHRKADSWLSPFEIYADKSRLRGELPSGLILSDECPWSVAQQVALAEGKRLVPERIIRDLLAFLGFERGARRAEYKDAIGKFQLFLGEQQTGVLTPLQVVRLIQISAIRGSAKAQRCLGILYLKGVGLLKNPARAEKWLTSASDQGDGEASFALSELYGLGDRGVEQNKDKSTRYQLLSATQGFGPTKSELWHLLRTAP
jgi:uncharacterized protein